jgi:VanZ family protein
VRRNESFVRVALASALVAVLFIILMAGLWPFNPFPANNVDWLGDKNGLRLGRNPIVVSRSPFQFTDGRWSSVSLEIWLTPARVGPANVFLSIYTPENPHQFRLMQYHDILLVKRDIKGKRGLWQDTTVGAGKVVYPSSNLFITLTASSKGTSFYLNGKLLRHFPDFFLSGPDLSGQLIFGTSPFEKQTWQGEWRALAIYGRELRPDEVVAHYEKWLAGGSAELVKESPLTVLYGFHEGSGTIIRDAGGTGPDLLIPSYYSVPHKPILQRPWEEYHPNLSYAADLAINIAGFVPLGFLLSAFLWSSTRCKRPILTTIIIGVVISLSIEILQGFIPQRSSGMTDIITNTGGTAIGCLMFVQGAVRRVFARLGIAKAGQESFGSGCFGDRKSAAQAS